MEPYGNNPLREILLRLDAARAQVAHAYVMASNLHDGIPSPLKAEASDKILLAHEGMYRLAAEIKELGGRISESAS